MLLPQHRGDCGVILCGCLALLVSHTSAFEGDSLPASMFGDRHGGGMTQWTNCTPTDSEPRDVSIGIAMTSNLFTRFGFNQSEAAQWVQSVVDGANFIYMNQLNVRLVVHDVFFAQNNGTSWDNPSCSMQIDAQLLELSEWTPPSEQALWHLMDNCLKGSEESTESFSNEKSGMAIKGSLCRMGPGADGKYANVGISNFFEVPVLGDITYRVFSHEVGHTFGASHPYGEEVVLKDGGIMSYGTGHYKCDLGFSPLNKEEVCAVLTSAEQTQCTALTVLTMSREQFMATIPAEPPNVDSDIVTCGYKDFSFAELVAGLLLVLILLCACCCCFMMCCKKKCCCCAGRRSRGKRVVEDEEIE